MDKKDIDIKCQQCELEIVDIKGDKCFYCKKYKIAPKGFKCPHKLRGNVGTLEQSYFDLCGDCGYIWNIKGKPETFRVD